MHYWLVLQCAVLAKRKVSLNMKEKEDQIKPLGHHVIPQRESYSTDTLSDGDALKAIRRRVMNEYIFTISWHGVSWCTSTCIKAAV